MEHGASRLYLHVMSVRAKICGLSTTESVDVSIAGGAAWLGFVFFPGSPRNIDLDAATALVGRAPAHVGTVAILVDPDDEMVLRAVSSGVSALQLHGQETPKRLAALRQHGLELWKAVPVRTRVDLGEARRFRGAADRILYDAKTPAGTLPGGMGLRFDWRLLDGFEHPLPWLLSGGLDAESLGEAVGMTGTAAVDVSSGVERAPGLKDVDKIAAFLQSAERS